MSETWAVVDEAGERHEVAVDEGRGPSRSWWAATPDVARRSHASARDAVVLVAQACGWGIAEVLSPGAETRASEVAHLEARRGALLAEVDRLTARDRDAGVVIEDLRKMLAAANADHAAARLDGAREMRERAAAEIGRFFMIHGDQARERILALPLPEAPPPQPKTPLCECGAAASGTRYVGSGSDGPHRTPCCRAHGGDTYEVARG